MHPRLVSKKHLRVATPSRVREASFVALAILVGVLGAATVRAGLSYREPVAQINPSPIIRLPLVAGTKVPKPPASFGLVPQSATGARGEFVFVAAAGQLKTAASKRLFDYYVSTMTANGWRVAARSGPTGSGEWALSLSLGRQQATISMYVRPSVSLTLDACPPFPYC